MLIKIALAVILSLGCSLKQAEAVPRRVNVRLVVCDSAPSYWPTALNIAIKKLRRVGVRLAVSTRRKCYDASADRSLSSFPGASSWYFSNVKRGKDITLILAGPLLQTYTAGVSSSTCSLHTSAAIVYLDDVDAAKSGVVISHELGHLIGASHDDSNVNVMRSWMESWYDFSNMGWNAAALNQIQGCLNGWRILRESGMNVDFVGE